MRLVARRRRPNARNPRSSYNPVSVFFPAAHISGGDGCSVHCGTSEWEFIWSAGVPWDHHSLLPGRVYIWEWQSPELGN